MMLPVAYRVRTGTAVPQRHVRPEAAKVIALGLACLLWLGGVHGAEISGIVLTVHDGDTLTIANWNATYKIRLTDIDAPEMAQPRGRDSRAARFHLCALKRATVGNLAKTASGARSGA